MALRLLEIILPSDRADDLRGVLGETAGSTWWRETLDDGQVVARVLLDANETTHLIDAVEDRFAQVTGYRLIVLPVLASLPRAEKPAAQDDGEDESDGETAPRPVTVAAGLSREELYHDVVDMTELSRVYIATVILSTLVAAVGMLRDNVAVIVGAMVIAPLLGPNVSLAFATTLGDLALIRRSIVTNMIGVLIALGLTIAIALLFAIDPTIPELASRTEVALSDIILATAAGAVGALAMTRGIPAALVGVMVAVALLPPTVAVGLMVGAGEWRLAHGALLLLATNVISINLAGVITFRLQGVRPRAWWEKGRAQRAAHLAIGIWLALLAVLAGLIIAFEAT